jgi:hypothetical protein
MDENRWEIVTETERGRYDQPEYNGFEPSSSHHGSCTYQFLFHYHKRLQHNWHLEMSPTNKPGSRGEGKETVRGERDRERQTERQREGRGEGRGERERQREREEEGERDRERERQGKVPQQNVSLILLQRRWCQDQTPWPPQYNYWHWLGRDESVERKGGGRRGGSRWRPVFLFNTVSSLISKIRNQR